MAISRRAVLAGSTALGLGGAAAIVGYRVWHGGGEAVLDEGLIGLWKFDETEGHDVRDATAFGNTGIIVQPGADARGTNEFAGAVSLGGPDGSFVRVPPSVSLNSIADAITVIASVYPRDFQRGVDSSDGHIALVQRQWRTGIHPDLFFLGYGPSGDALDYKWHVGLTEGAPGIYARTEMRTPTVGQWVHLAGVYDGATGEMSLYVDGELISSRSEKGQFRLDAESLGRPLIIGAELNGESTDEVSGLFNGYIDEVRIYGRALAGSEVAALATKAK